MHPIPQTQARNLILSALPEKEYNQLLPELEPITMQLGEIIHQPNERIKYVHFPQDSIVSSVTFLNNGTSVEAGIVGREGTTGVSVALGRETSPRQVSVQSAGDCLRIKTDKFRAALKQLEVLEFLVRQHISAFVSQTSQIIACNAHHSIDARLARWLLMTQDRVESYELLLTQDFMAQMLGVHRPGVTIAALSLKEAGIIDYRRGNITICDRAGLEKISCECYKVIKKEYDSYLNAINH
jgi:CRP-like cAMP-binding protein